MQWIYWTISLLGFHQALYAESLLGTQTPVMVTLTCKQKTKCNDFVINDMRSFQACPSLKVYRSLQIPYNTGMNKVNNKEKDQPQDSNCMSSQGHTHFSTSTLHNYVFLAIILCVLHRWSTATCHGLIVPVFHLQYTTRLIEVERFKYQCIFKSHS